MPAGNIGLDGQPPEVYAQALAARKHAQFLHGELVATKQKAAENWQLIQDAWIRTEQIHARRMSACTDPDRLRYSAYARLQARLASMPVIEQAKGIIMAQQGWPEDRAFDALRRISQRDNVRVRDLAASIVARATRSAPARRRAAPASAAAPSRGGDLIPRVGSGASRDRQRSSA